MHTCHNQSYEALSRAVGIVGSQVALAKILGKSQPHIYKWLNSPNGVPPEHCFSIEQATAGLVTRRDLRPDDWEKIWPELASPVLHPNPIQIAAAEAERNGGMRIPMHTDHVK